MSTREEKENRWVAQFDKEFPSITSKDVTTRQYKIDFIRQRGKARFEEYQKKQKEKDERHQAYAEEKKQRREAAYNRKEAEYLELIKEALGNDWYKLIRETQYDCKTAILMRYEEEERAQQEEWEDEIAEREFEKKMEEDRKEQKRKRKEHMETLSPEELKKYKKELREKAEEEDYMWESAMHDESCRYVRAMEQNEVQLKKNDALWTAWLKNKYPWDWNEMKKLIYF